MTLLTDTDTVPQLGDINLSGRAFLPHVYDGTSRWVWPETRLTYEYEGARIRAGERGQTWLQSWVPQTDVEFSAADLTQNQVDAMLDMYGRHVAHLFNPRTYSWLQRVALAAFFLFNFKPRGS